MYIACRNFNAFPLPGGLLDQTAEFVAASSVIENLICKSHDDGS